jgi:hypothetical protein
MFIYKLQSILSVTSNYLITWIWFKLSYFYLVSGITVQCFCWHCFYYAKVVNKWMTSGHFTVIACCTSFIILCWWFFDMCCWNEVAVLMYILDSCQWIQISMMETHSSFRFTHFTCLKHLGISIFAMYYITHNAPIHCSRGISYLSN